VFKYSQREVDKVPSVEQISQNLKDKGKSTMGKLRVFVGTWNVNAKTSDGLDLERWLCSSTFPPDIVSVCLQEVVQLSDVTTYMQQKKSEEQSETWARRFMATLEGHKEYEGAKYKILAVSQLIGVMTCILIKEDHIDRIDKLMVGYFAVGRFGVLGNKGAVALKFSLRIKPHKFKSFCFVGCHLSAHQHEVAKRNADYAAICNGLEFVPIEMRRTSDFLSRSVVPVEQILGLRRTTTVNSLDGLEHAAMEVRREEEERERREREEEEARKRRSSKWRIRRRSKRMSKSKFANRAEKDDSTEMNEPASSHDHNEDYDDDFSKQDDLVAVSYGRKSGPPTRIEDHDLVFWFGDLNYRVDAFTWEEAISLVKIKNLHKLLENDQLIIERAHKRVFHGFNEGVINFVPTYKFEPGTNNYDTRGGTEKSKKKPRVPAWCDRVLWKTRDESRSNMIQQCSYFSCAEFLASDHKPVGAEFVLPFVELFKPKKNAGGIPRKDRTREEQERDNVLPVLDVKDFAKNDDVDESSKDLESSRTLRGDTSGITNEESDEESTSDHDEDFARETMSLNKELTFNTAIRSVVAVVDFQARSLDELSFATGDLLELFLEDKIKIDDGWLLGRRVLDGNIGYFPSYTVNALGAVSNPTRKSFNTNRALKKATARRYHRKKLEREQRIRRETKKAAQEEEAQSRRAKLFGRLRKIVAQNTQKETEHRTWSMEYLGTNRYSDMVATESYTAKDPDELSFNRGDVAKVLSICPDMADSKEGWYMARVGKNEGLVPRNLFEPIL